MTTTAELFVSSQEICLVGVVVFGHTIQENKSEGVSDDKHFELPLKNYNVFINGKCGATDQPIHVRNMDASEFTGSHSTFILDLFIYPTLTVLLTLLFLYSFFH
jgi:hypothetical protein